MKSHFQPLSTLLQRSGPLRYPTFQLIMSLLQLFLHLFAFSDVVSDARDSRHRSRTITDWKGSVPNPTDGAIRSHDAVFFIIRTGRLFCERRFQNAFSVVRMNGFEPGSGREVEALTRPPPDRFIRGTDIEDGILGCITQPEDFLDMLGHLPELLLTLTQSRLDLITLCNIHRDSTDQRQLPPLVDDGEFAHHAFM